MANVNITVTFDSTVQNRIVDGLCGAYSYDSAIEGNPNPPTKAQFAKQRIIDFIKKTVKDYETSVQVQTDSSTISADIESKLTLS